MIGAVIAGVWTVLLVSGQVPEIGQGDRTIWFHLTAEFLTAGLLAAAGVGIVAGRRWGDRSAGIALGALLYTTVSSSGYYAEAAGEWATVGMFGLLAIASGLVARSWLIRYRVERR